MAKNSPQQIIKDDRKQIVEKIIQDMQSEGIAWARPFLLNASPNNPTTGTTYRGINRFRLAFAAYKHGYKDPRWCTFNQAMKKGWHINKGAKSEIIENWKEFPIYDEKEIDPETGDKKIIGSYVKPVGFWRVFNAQDIEGISSYEDLHVYDKSIDIANTLIQSSRCDVVVDSTLSTYGGYSPTHDYIVLAPREVYRSDEVYTRTLLHEMMHSTGHSSALNRPYKFEFGSPEYAFEELIAEIGSLFAASDLGLQSLEYDDAFYNNHIAYIQNWAEVLSKDPDKLFQAAAHSEKASSYVLKRYEHELEIEKEKELVHEVAAPSLMEHAASLSSTAEVINEQVNSHSHTNENKER